MYFPHCRNTVLCKQADYV
uniref:Uncharacterized protein n=1 Tax=Anguilla anguilla TaxID=7936 RepID=A0A0E9PUC9_ANGAN